MIKKIVFIFVILGMTISSVCANEEYLDLSKTNIKTNAPITQAQYDKARKIILNLQKEMPRKFKKGYGPFLAAIYDEDGKLIAKTQNSVIPECDCTNHAEMNAIRAAQKKLNTYDLSNHNLSLYVTAEPCIMCAGGIMWSGIKNIYFGVYSKDVEEITGFDEGYKPNWIEQFKLRGINVYGGIEEEYGKNILKMYVNQGNTVYKPERQGENN